MRWVAFSLDLIEEGEEGNNHSLTMFAWENAQLSSALPCANAICGFELARNSRQNAGKDGMNMDTL